MKFNIPRRLPMTEIASLEEASKLYQKVRNDSLEGASTFPFGTIRNGKLKYKISYNGRVWLDDIVVLEAAR